MSTRKRKQEDLQSNNVVGQKKNHSCKAKQTDRINNVKVEL